jgi:hypothetical protein
MAISPEPTGARMTGVLGVNSTSPVVGSGVLIVNVKPPQAVPAMPVAGPLTRKTAGSSCPAGQGTGKAEPQAGTCLISLSVNVPPLSGIVEVLVIVRPTATFVCPTCITGGYVGAIPTPTPAHAARPISMALKRTMHGATTLRTRPRRAFGAGAITKTAGQVDPYLHIIILAFSSRAGSLP